MLLVSIGNRTNTVLVIWKTSLLIFFVLVVCYSSYSQNLVPNGSFELKSACPTYAFQANKIISWYDLPMHQGTVDYFDVCATNVIAQVPVNYMGSEIAASGNSYIGLITYGANTNNREYLETKLVSPMTAGVEYVVSFKYSVAEECKNACANFGVYFSTTQAQGTYNNGPIPVSAQLSTLSIDTNKSGWSTISWNYIAAGGEEYVTLGNFLDDVNSTVQVLNAGSGSYGYIYIDDVSIEQIKCTLQVNLGNDSSLCFGKTLILDASTKDAQYLWSDNSTDSILTTGSEGNYWVKVTVGNCEAFDTVTIKFLNCAVLKLPNVFTPNNDGFNDYFSPIVSNQIASMRTTIYDRWGVKLYETDNPLIEWDGQNHSAGTYFWVVNYINLEGVNKTLNGCVTIIR